jgi:predicted glycogen debranching enzyme
MEPLNLTMTPGPGERLLRFVGDKVLFTLRGPNSSTQPKFRALLRTNLGRARARRQEILFARAGRAVVANSSWRDVPMQKTTDGWRIELPLAETGFFKAKPYLLDEKNWQHWPDGSDAGICVHPEFVRTANTIYCAFTRLFGATRNLPTTDDEKLERQLKSLEALGFATLPPSGKFRDLTRQLPHIVNRLGCRILHLLPVHPTPTTYARFGRFGSPYAALDLTAVDPALIEFDKRTTGIDQFCELTHSAHSLGARVLIDIVINHTGWGSSLQENRPEFFLKNPNGEFASPGAWGTVWEDLVELEQHDVKLWDVIADSLLIWCRRGVDGFRCDAGYKIPAPAWQYIVARVQEEFPDTIFLLEGLGGSWDATELLLTEGGMQWAYSELFQNYSGKQVASYLDYANRQDERIGSYVHYSETHDNNRLAARQASSVLPEPPIASAEKTASANLGRAWSLLRNRLCALTSPCGGFGFTCGVEWLATEKIRVHGNTGLNWGSTDNIIPELAHLNQLVADHPCFFDGAKLTRLSPLDSPVYALLRESAEGKDSVLVLINTDVEKSHSLAFKEADLRFEVARFQHDLLGEPLPQFARATGEVIFALVPGACHCLATTQKPAGLNGERYRRARAQGAFAFKVLNQTVPIDVLDGLDWPWLAAQVERSPRNFLAAASGFAADNPKTSFTAILSAVESKNIFPRVVVWTLIDARRITLVPDAHWLFIEDTAPFRAVLEIPGANGSVGTDEPVAVHVQSIPAGNFHVAFFAPQAAGEAKLLLERYAETSQKISAILRFLAPYLQPESPTANSQLPDPAAMVLLTNGVGGMSRLRVDLGRVQSKYDCALGANLDPHVPVDRHIFVKRIRAWVNADGFLSALDFKNLVSFSHGSPAVWDFVANAGDGRTVEIRLRAEMIQGQNTTVFQFSRPSEKNALGKQLPADADVRLSVRADIEDRNFHSETKRNSGADFHFTSNTRDIKYSIAAAKWGEGWKLKMNNCTGFEFTPAGDRQLRVFADTGEYHPQPEWCENIPHPVEQSRGQVSSGDAYSPGWFELPLAKGDQVRLVATAEFQNATDILGSAFPPPNIADPSLVAQLVYAAKQFVVRRDEGKTVIAGYPWFLDWGRDSLICARGLLAARMRDDVKQLLLTFAKFEKDGTLPNTIHGNDVSNRDTSDAPLWFAVVCEELVETMMNAADTSAGGAAEKLRVKRFFDTAVNERGRTIRDVLTSIAENYRRGTPNGIHMDPDSALIWSPAHFTWMDTNYPAGTPREGYPVEIQALWIRLLRLLAGISEPSVQKQWHDLAEHAVASFEKLFWLEQKGWFADVLIGDNRVIARDAIPSDALRNNCLFAVSLGLINGDRAKRCVEAAQKYLVVPGGLRTLAPLPVTIPLPIYRDGQLLNDPPNPYWPRYEGDEDTRRKPAYHNGTAWTWTFPTFCEALASAWDFSPEAVAAAKSYLGSAKQILNEGCLGQLPEIFDGDAPHAQRGCDAQAWGVTETLRVWKLLSEHEKKRI